MLRTQRGKMAPEGSPENGDVGELMRALGDGAISDLSNKTVDDLKNVYRLCFPGGKGISRFVLLGSTETWLFDFLVHPRSVPAVALVATENSSTT